MKKPLPNKPLFFLLLLLALSGTLVAGAQTTFRSTTPLSIPDGDPPPVAGIPYPSALSVSGLSGLVSEVSLTLHGLTHNFPDAVDILLVAPDGTNALVLSDAGGATDIRGLTLHFSDTAAASLPDYTTFSSGSYRPTNFGSGDVFPAPAPLPSGLSSFSHFDGTLPNGTWSLYIVSDLDGTVGALSGGWSLTLTTVSGGKPESMNDFQALYRPESGDVLCSWSTDTEFNTDRFIVERSSGGNNWNVIGEVKADRFSSTPNEYRFSDSTPLTGNSLYRLRLLLRDGSSRQSKVAAVNIKGAPAFSMSPNPASSYTDISTGSGNPEWIRVQVTDWKGTEWGVTEGWSGTAAPLRLPVERLSPGTYIVQVWNGKERTGRQLKVLR